MNFTFFIPFNFNSNVVEKIYVSICGTYYRWNYKAGYCLMYKCEDKNPSEAHAVFCGYKLMLIVFTSVACLTQVCSCLNECYFTCT